MAMATTGSADPGTAGLPEITPERIAAWKKACDKKSGGGWCKLKNTRGPKCTYKNNPGNAGKCDGNNMPW
jgi:hypothetical protein